MRGNVKNRNKPTERKMEEGISPPPTAREIFFFDAGRSYQAGLALSLSKVNKLLLEEFKLGCRLILVRYLDAEREDAIGELYKAFIEGFEKGETARDEGLKVIPWGAA